MGTLLTALALVTSLSLSLVSVASGQQGVVAKVNGVAITEADLENAIDNYVPPGTFHGAMGKKRDQYRQPALDFLIERELLYQEAAQRGLKASDKEVDKALSEVRKQFKDKKAFERALKESGFTLDEYRKVIRRNIAIDALLKAEVGDKSKYTDKEIESYYAANKAKFVKPEALRIRHILVQPAPPGGEKEKNEAREKASALLKRIQGGEDFAALAEKNSDDDYRIKGGDLGWIHRGRLEPALEEAAFKMKVGESTLVETQYGFHILKVEGKRPAEQLGYAEVKDSAKKDLESKKQEELNTALMKRLREKAKIEIVE